MPKKDLYAVMYTDNAYNLSGTIQANINELVIHSDFNCRSRANDIAILTLAKRFELVKNLAQISKSATVNNEAGVIAGFGRLYDVIFL